MPLVRSEGDETSAPDPQVTWIAGDDTHPSDFARRFGVRLTLPPRYVEKGDGETPDDLERSHLTMTAGSAGDPGAAKMRSAIAHMTDSKGLRQVMENARARKRDGLYWCAFERLCEVLGRAAYDPGDPALWRLERTVHAFEELRDSRPASRTRQMMGRRRAMGTIKQWRTYGRPTDGHASLVKAGLRHLLGEAIALDFPDRFTENEIAVARYRIADAKQGRVSEPFLPTGRMKKPFGP
ncbi:MAG: hypothetical protein ACREFO_15825 [Acetobacteraceae bacterium]